MTGPVQSVQETVRSMRPSTRARLLALLAVITPAGLVMVNIAAYVMANLAAFRLAITVSAVVSTIVLNAITAFAAYRTIETRFAASRWLGWLFQPRHARSNAVCGLFLLVVAATVSGELTYKGLSDPRKIPNLQTFLAGLLGLAVPLVLAALFRDQVAPRGRRRYRTRS
ncbi:MAG: hypothetical protein M3010_11815 [Candidatus Dormibacteraeota bacterium]|nr:hypothetical protein [Candidatus Dormibacteraeota bacterium]